MRSLARSRWHGNLVEVAGGIIHALYLRILLHFPLVIQFVFSRTRHFFKPSFLLPVHGIDLVERILNLFVLLATHILRILQFQIKVDTLAELVHIDRVLV